jgi:hypothetical protein
MPGDIIDFGAEKERRDDAADEAEINGNQAEWERTHLQLVQIMATSSLHDTGLTSATLRALLDVLQNSDMSLDDAKARITRCLAAFI